MSKLSKNDLQNIANLEAKMRSVPDIERIEKIHSLKISKTLFAINAAELLNKLGWAKVPPNIYTLWMIENRSYLYEFQLNIMRMLQNLITSASALVSHTRKFHKNLYAQTGEFDDYSRQVKSRFENNEAIQFVHQLRNYYQHFSPIAVARSLGPPKNGVSRHKIYIKKSELLQGYEWGAWSKKFLSKSSEDIELYYLISDYVAAIDAFHVWINKRLAEIHAPGIGQLKDYESKIIRIKSKEYPERIMERIGLIQNNGGVPEDIFSSLVDRDAFIHIMLKGVWVERLSDFVAEIQTERKLSPDIIKKINDVFTRHYYPNNT